MNKWMRFKKINQQKNEPCQKQVSKSYSAA